MIREILENGMARLKLDFEWAKMNGTVKLYRSTKYMTSMKYCSTFAVHYYSNKRSLVISSVPEGKLMGVELIGVYKSGSINWG